MTAHTPGLHSRVVRNPGPQLGREGTTGRTHKEELTYRQESDPRKGFDHDTGLFQGSRKLENINESVSNRLLQVVMPDADGFVHTSAT